MSFALSPLVARAGTTGAIVGRVTDAVTHAPVAGARVSIASPAQTASTLSDAAGNFRFLSLVPDTYTVGVERAGYDTASLAGVTVLADQTQTVPIVASKSLQRIGRVTARGSGDLVKPGTTSDVYSVNPASAEAAQALGGPGGLNTAYSAIASVPGVVVQQGQQGWYQTVSIRGGDIDQVGYELDGIPVNRVYDNAPQTTLSSIGQQELQVYTGGTPASADASGIAGYINQVIKTGTSPGFVIVSGGIASPTYYHKLSLEVGGATPNRLFSYYAGVAGVNQDFRYLDQYQGASDPRFFYPISFPGRFNLYDGTAGNVALGPGDTYAIASTSDRENVVNFHFGIPHKQGGLKDDVQLLYLTSEVVSSYFSSINDQGGAAAVSDAVGNNGFGFQHDGYSYTGPLFATPTAAGVAASYFPNSPQPRPYEQAVANSARDYTDNGVAIAKLQYQRNFDAKSYLRLFGYTEYSNWFIGGPANQQFTGYYGAELNDYELPSHTFGLNASYSNQLSDHHLISATASYQGSQVQRRYSYGYPGNSLGYGIANYVGKNGRCYDAAGGGEVSCFDNTFRGTLPADPPGTAASATDVGALGALFATNAPAGTAAADAGARWLATDNGYASTRLNQVSPAFTSASLSDQWRPNERLLVNVGARVENYDDRLADTTQSPARQFWFDAYNREHCYKAGAPSPVSIFGATDPVTGATVMQSSAASCADVFGTGFVASNLVNALAPHVTATIVEPRLSGTYTVDPLTVLRASYGVYARAVNTSWLQYDAVNQDLASFIGGNFLTLGYNTPVHDLRPDTSNNYDFSLEHQFRGTDLSFKLTPFYRSTKNQLQPVPIGVGGVVTGFNVGQQVSSGVELAVKKGDFAHDGIAAQLAYTYTRSRIRYEDFPSGTNVIDGLNQYVQEYNSYTSACATVTAKNAKLCGLAPGAANPNAAASFAAVGTGGTADPTLPQTRNPYYGAAPQPLLDRSAEYETYDQIPQIFTGENGYDTPDVLSLILQYRHARFAFTPSLTFSSGAEYGSPLSYPGYLPNGCAGTGAVAANGTVAADPKSCTGTSAVSGFPFLIVPDAFTGRFDDLGAFEQPSRLTLNLGASFEATKDVKLSVALTGLVDTCFQRGYAWDDPHVCVYSQLPSGGAGLGPSGNFLPLASTPVALRYPYAPFNNNLNTGFVGVTIPIQATFNVQVKL